MSHVLTPRQQRERDFFDRDSSQPRVSVKLDAIRGDKHRPSNSYWCVLETARDRYAAGARRLLDFGCGIGNDAVVLATLGYDVCGFDVSPQSVEVARKTAAAHGVAERTHFSVQTAERLEYPDNYFDIVLGIDILHHVEVVPSVKEALRVLKPGGVALFREFAEAPIIDPLRNTRLLLRMFPKEKDLCITEDERKLTAADIKGIRAVCPQTIERRSAILARFDRYVHDPQKDGPTPLEKVDYWISEKLPVLAKFGGSVVLELHKA